MTRVLRGALADTRPLRTPAYRRLWLAGTVTVIGAQLSVVAVPTQIYQLTGSSAWVGLTGLFGLVPLIVFGLWGGAIADAVDRRVLLLVTGTGIAVSSLALWVTATSGIGGVWTVLVLFAVQTGVPGGQPADPQRRAAPAAARRAAARGQRAEHDRRAGRCDRRSAAGRRADPGDRPAHPLPAGRDRAAVHAVGHLAAAAGARRRRTGARRRAGLREVVDGFRYAAMHKVLLVSFLIDIVAMGVGLPRVVFPEISHTVFGDPVGGGMALGLLFAAIPMGMVAAGLFSGWLHRIRRQGVAVTVAICVWGLGVALFGLTGSLLLAVLALALAGAGDMVSSVFRSSMLQSVATDEMRGRMQGVFIVVVAGGPRLGDLWHGPAAAAIGPGPAATAGGIGVIVLALAVVAAFPAFWRYRAPAQGDSV